MKGNIFNLDKLYNQWLVNHWTVYSHMVQKYLAGAGTLKRKDKLFEWCTLFFLASMRRLSSSKVFLSCLRKGSISLLASSPWCSRGRTKNAVRAPLRSCQQVRTQKGLLHRGSITLREIRLAINGWRVSPYPLLKHILYWLNHFITLWVSVGCVRARYLNMCALSFII